MQDWKSSFTSYPGTQDWYTGFQGLEAGRGLQAFGYTSHPRRGQHSSGSPLRVHCGRLGVARSHPIKARGECQESYPTAAEQSHTLQ